MIDYLIVEFDVRLGVMCERIECASRTTRTQIEVEAEASRIGRTYVEIAIEASARTIACRIAD